MNSVTKFTSGIGLAIVASGVAMAQDNFGYYGPSSFEGFYVGGYAGGVLNPGTSATVGAMAGANFGVNEVVIVGAEMQGGATFGAATTGEVLGLARGGVILTQDAMIYGALGAGWDNGATVWAVGGGAEFRVVDSIGARGEVVGSGVWGGGLTKTRATLGIVYHVK